MMTKRLWLDRDPVALEKWQTLLAEAGLLPDTQVAYTIGIYAGETLIATGSIYKTILKCIAIHPAYQNENLLTEIVQQLRNRLQEAGITHYFLYTKPQTSPLFHSLGFTEIVMTEQVAFMEQGAPDFRDYLTEISQYKRPTAKNAAIVINANPFTNGHLYLITETAKKNETVYVFVVSEDVSCFDADVRFRLVKEGVKKLKNVVVLPTREYLVSSATFPAYFLKEQAPSAISKVQATVDAVLFKERIAPALAITSRVVGEEPLSPVTNIYNQTMQKVFAPEFSFYILPRIQVDGEVISASKVRQLMKQNDYEKIKALVPPTTLKEIMKQKKE